MKKTDSAQSTVFSLLVNAASLNKNGVFWLNADGHILAVNEAYAVQLGYTLDSFEPKTIFEVNPSTSFLSWKRFWKKLIVEIRIDHDTEQITSDESIYPVHARMILMEVDGNQICMVLVEDMMQANRFKDLLEMTSEIAGIGSWELDLVHNNFVLTDEIYRLLRLPAKKDISKEDIKDLFKSALPPDDYINLIDQLTEAVRVGKPFSSELSINLNGKTEVFSINANPVVLEDQTIKVYGTLQNIAKISKRTDEMYFTKFCLDNSRDMIFWVNETDQCFSYVNEMTCKTLGYFNEELIGQHYKAIIHNDEPGKPMTWDYFGKQNESEEAHAETELNFKGKDGKLIPVSIVTDRLNFRGKKINCTFARNISKKIKRDEVIKMAKTSLDQSTDMIFWLNPDATFRYFNDAFVEGTGYKRKEIEKMTIVNFFLDSTMENFRAGWNKLQQGAVLASSDRKMRLKSGIDMPVELKVNLVKVGNKEYSSTVLRDVTLRKRKETELHDHLKHIERLKESTEAENIQLKEEINLEASFNNIISKDKSYKKVLRQVEQVADTDATVLILGETGTGKELLARAVHQLSERADYPMIKVNCGALPENLIESELFGHEKGAFTGAYQQKIGKFERADKGTIFLDEIGELPLDLQTQLLRVLQEGEIERVGGTEMLNIDVRVVAATNRNLEEQVATGKFREDLYYRLNVFPIYNLPLRERREDIPILVNHFTDKYSKKLNKEISEISQSGMNKLMTYPFLGNVRELENMVERAVILAKGKVLNFDTAILKQKSAVSSKFKTMEEMQKHHIADALRKTNGKVSGDDGAAFLLGMNDKTLTSRMKKLDIDKRDYIN